MVGYYGRPFEGGTEVCRISRSERKLQCMQRDARQSVCQIKRGAAIVLSSEELLLLNERKHIRLYH